MLLATALLAIGGCTAVPTGSTTAPPRLPTASYTTAGLERVLGHDAPALQRLFGEPQLDVREGPARKLQFGGACVLDAYLYPSRAGSAPVVTHVDARQADGRPIDRAACVSALAGARSR
nr:hypothetical protein [Sphingomonas jejuensis]